MYNNINKNNNKTNLNIALLYLYCFCQEIVSNKLIENIRIGVWLKHGETSLDTRSF